MSAHGTLRDQIAAAATEAELRQAMLDLHDAMARCVPTFGVTVERRADGTLKAATKSAGGAS